MALTPQSFPLATQPIADGSGRVTQSWRQFLLSLWNRTGGTGDIGNVLKAGPGIHITPDLATYVISATGGGLVSIIDYGGKCDGDPATGAGTDDLAAWNAAIADVNARKVRGILVPGFSRISAPLPQITQSMDFFGIGEATSGIFATAGGDVTFIDVNYSGAATSFAQNLLRFSMRDFYMGTMQQNVGQAMRLHMMEACGLSMTNVQVVGFPSRFGGGSPTQRKGWKRGIETINATNANFSNVTVFGCADPTGLLAYPASVLVAEWAWYTHADVGHSSTNNRWSNCDVLWFSTAWKGRGHLEGFSWVTCCPAFLGTAWDIQLSDVTLSPYFEWVNCQSECFHDDLILDNASYAIVLGCEFFVDYDINVDRTAVKVSNCYHVDVSHNQLVCVGASSGPNLGTTNFLKFDGVDTGKSTKNRLIAFNGKGVWFTGGSINCTTDGDYVPATDPACTPYINDAASPLTNKRRRMEIPGATATQGPESASDANAAGGLNLAVGAFTEFLQIPFGVQPGDQIRVSAHAYVTSPNSDYAILSLREYTHRPGSGTPYQVIQFGDSQRNYVVETITRAGGSKGEGWLNACVVFDVIAAADDAVITMSMESHVGAMPVSEIQMKVERL